jgi:hypothetical protein
MKFSFFYAASFAVLLASCKKENVTTTLPEQPPMVTQVPLWERAVGGYKVYDLQGTFLYAMQITHSQNFDSIGNRVDSLFFLNFNGQFNFGTLQQPSDYYSDLIRMDSHTVLDSNGVRWGIDGWVGYGYDNNIDNGQIPLRYLKYNTPFYVEDSITHISTEINQMAIKQP